MDSIQQIRAVTAVTPDAEDTHHLSNRSGFRNHRFKDFFCVLERHIGPMREGRSRRTERLNHNLPVRTERFELSRPLRHPALNRARLPFSTCALASLRHDHRARRARFRLFLAGSSGVLCGRMRQDSNLRAACTAYGLASRCFGPLSHASLVFHRGRAAEPVDSGAELAQASEANACLRVDSRSRPSRRHASCLPRGAFPARGSCARHG